MLDAVIHAVAHEVEILARDSASRVDQSDVVTELMRKRTLHCWGHLEFEHEMAPQILALDERDVRRRIVHRDAV